MQLLRCLGAIIPCLPHIAVIPNFSMMLRASRNLPSGKETAQQHCAMDWPAEAWLRSQACLSILLDSCRSTW